MDSKPSLKPLMSSVFLEKYLSKWNCRLERQRDWLKEERRRISANNPDNLHHDEQFDLILRFEFRWVCTWCTVHCAQFGEQYFLTTCNLRRPSILWHSSTGTVPVISAACWVTTISCRVTVTAGSRLLIETTVLIRLGRRTGGTRARGPFTYTKRVSSMSAHTSLDTSSQSQYGTW